MTLNTAIYAHGPVDHREVFLKCNQLIGATEATRSEDSQDDYGKNPAWTLMNEPGQGLDGWLFVHYRPGAALRPEPEGCEEWCGEDCDGGHAPACWLEVDLDTAYSYSDALGGCGDMHARFVAALGKMLDERGVSWSWKNEFTGEIHQGAEGLDGLGSGGAEASAWMRSTVLPAIVGRLSEEG